MVEPRTPGYSVSRLLVSRQQDGRWGYPRIAPFTGEGRDGDVPFFSPDGKRLYFMSRRPLPPADESSGEHIWYMARQGDGWAEARPVDDAVNRLPHHWQFSVDRITTFISRRPSAAARGGTISIARDTRTAVTLSRATSAPR